MSTLAVVTEAMYVLDFSVTAQTDFLRWIRDGAITLVDVENADLTRKRRTLPGDSVIRI